MKKDKWLVCLSGYWSDSYIYGIGNTVLQFHSDGYRILWVNSIPNRNISVKRVGSRSTLLRNLLRKLKSHLRPIKRIKPDFFVLTPFYLPFVENKVIYKVNLVFLKLQIRFVRLLLGIEDGFILFSSTMVNTPYIFKRKPYLKYFQYIADLYSDYREASEELRRTLRVMEKDIFNFADYLLFSSRLVQEKVSGIVEDHSKILYYPHGVDFDHFDKAPKEITLHYKHPIIGYFGSLTMANDQSVILELANSGFSVVLIGRKSGDYSACEANENIYFLGEISYEQLPRYANNFDVAFMAWKPGQWIDNSNPKKTYEYLALGLPIVSQPINQVKLHLNDIVYFATTPHEFVEQVKKAIEENSNSLISKRKLIASEVDWSVKYNIIKNLLYE